MPEYTPDYSFGSQYGRYGQAPGGGSAYLSGPAMDWSSPQMMGAYGQMGSSLQGAANGMMGGASLAAYQKSLGQMGPLPYASQYAGQPSQFDAGLAMLGGQASDLNSMQVNPMTLAAARNAAAQASAGQGLSGPLAGAIQSNAENQAFSQWDQWRRQMLMQTLAQRAGLLGQQHSMMGEVQQQALAKAQRDAQLAAMKKQQDMAMYSGLGGLIGGGVGLGVTALTGGAAAPFMPLFMGGGSALGGALGGAF